jgi:hypothetical protein
VRMTRRVMEWNNFRSLRPLYTRPAFLMDSEETVDGVHLCVECTRRCSGKKLVCTTASVMVMSLGKNASSLSNENGSVTGIARPFVDGTLRALLKARGHIVDSHCKQK